MFKSTGSCITKVLAFNSSRKAVNISKQIQFNKIRSFTGYCKTNFVRYRKIPEQQHDPYLIEHAGEFLKRKEITSICKQILIINSNIE